ncbi:hypothetical protein MPLB_70007 [Mesorhizobium sp. ORS 3324]|nr:hypothetical protein MPLB_70007 [Mesorhizobium sp. ORS 3324]
MSTTSGAWRRGPGTDFGLTVPRAVRDGKSLRTIAGTAPASAEDLGQHMVALEGDVAARRFEKGAQHIAEGLGVLDRPTVAVSEEGLAEVRRRAFVLHMLEPEPRDDLLLTRSPQEGGEDDLFLESVALAQHRQEVGRHSEALKPVDTRRQVVGYAFKHVTKREHLHMRPPEIRGAMQRLRI